MRSHTLLDRLSKGRPWTKYLLLGRRVCVLGDMAQARQLSKASRRRLNAEKVWKQDVETEDETDILTEWIRALRRHGYKVGLWRQVRTVTTDPRTGKPYAVIKDIPKADKVPGLLVKIRQ